MNIFEKFAISYVIDRGGMLLPHKTILKKIHELVLQDSRLTIGQINKDTGLSNHVIHNRVTARLNIERKLSAR